MIILQLFVVQVVVLVVIFFFFKMLFHRHLNDALMRLKSLQKEGEIKEEQLKEEVERAKRMKAYEVERGKKEAKALMEEAKKEISVLRSRIEDEAKQKSRRIIHHGEEELEKIKANLFSEIEDEAIFLSLETIKHAFTQLGRENLQHQFIQELMPEIEKIKEEQITEKISSIKVISSLPLTEDEKKRLKQVLSKKIGIDIKLNEEINDELIVGLIIYIGALVIDGSLRSKLNKLIPHLKKVRRERKI